MGDKGLERLERGRAAMKGDGSLYCEQASVAVASVFFPILFSLSGHEVANKRVQEGHQRVLT